MEQNTTTNKKLSKKQIIAIAAVGAAVILVAVVGIILFNTVFNRLDVMEYIKVETADGFEGSGFAEVNLDYVALAEELDFEEQRDIRKFRELEEENLVSLSYLIESKENRIEIEKEYDLDLDELYDLGRAIRINIRNNEGYLSNGDVVKVTVKIRESADFKKKLIGGEIEHEISGLKSLFAAEILVLPAFTGTEGKGSVTAHASLDPSYGDWVNDIYFNCTFSANDTLSNGDTVTITATVSDYESAASLAKQYGYSLNETTTVDVTVSGLTKLIELSDLTPEVAAKVVTYALENDTFPELDYQVFGVFYVDPIDPENTDNNVVVALLFPDGSDVFQHIRGIRNVGLDENGNIVSESTYFGNILMGKNYKDEQLKAMITGYYGETEYTITQVEVGEIAVEELETSVDGGNIAPNPELSSQPENDTSPDTAE